jgi:hypothetical protein
LRPSTDEWTEDEGPYRYAVYDEEYQVGSWYRYDFVSQDFARWTSLSEPFEADTRRAWTLVEVLRSTARLFGEAFIESPAGGSSPTEATIPRLVSSITDPSLLRGWSVYVAATPNDAPPLGEVTRLDEVDTATGQVTFATPLSAAIPLGSTVYLGAYWSWDQLIEAVNRALGEMQFVDEQIFAVVPSRPLEMTLPWQIRSASDVLGMWARDKMGNEFPYAGDIRLVYGRPTIVGPAPGLPFLRVQGLRYYLDLSGPLERPSDETTAPLPWLRTLAARRLVDALLLTDPEEQELVRIGAYLDQESRRMAGFYAPDIVRPYRRGPGRTILPGPYWRS